MKRCNSPEEEERRFFEIAELLRSTDDEAEKRRLKDERARLTFGDPACWPGADKESG